jgi:hypothetical protein
MLGIDSAFDHKALGHAGFLDFLRATGIVRLTNQGEGIWLAARISSHADTRSSEGEVEVEALTPRQRLRKCKWRNASPEALRAAFDLLNADKSFRRRTDMVAWIVENSDDELEASDLGKAVNLLYKARSLERDPTMLDGEPSRWRLRQSVGWEELLECIDLELLKRAVPPPGEPLPKLDEFVPLLIGGQSQERGARLLTAALADREEP